jgi:hypothetical protein
LSFIALPSIISSSISQLFGLSLENTDSPQLRRASKSGLCLLGEGKVYSSVASGFWHFAAGVVEVGWALIDGVSVDVVDVAVWGGGA